MKTTELYIEQVLIGFLVIAIGALPWHPELSGKLSPISVAEGSVLLGLAFLLGIPFDRFADTLSERLDRHNRLQFALDKWVGNKFPAPKPAPNHDELVYDIFAEDDFRLKALREKDAVVNWIEYHRSRIRLARALAVYGPALTLSLTLAMSRSVKEIRAREVGLWLSSVAAGYLIWAIIVNPPKSVRDQTNSSRVLRTLFGMGLPRTDHARFLTYAMKWHGVDGMNTLLKATRGSFRVWFDEWRSLAVPVLVLVAALLLGIENSTRAAGVAGTGALVTVISTWAWWRINITYRSYLHDICTNPSRCSDSLSNDLT